jgi:uncharacterized protein (TIGR03066 family)
MAKLFKRLFCIILLAASMGSAALAAAGDAERLVGFWREIGRSEALIEFTANGKVTAYFPKARTAKRLDGVWKLDPDGNITMTFTLGRRSMTQKGTLSFEGEAMVLTDQSGDKTRHRRHSGPLPDWAK